MKELSKIGQKTLQLIVKELTNVAFEAFEWSVEKWAEKAKVHYTTINRLINSKTRFVRLETVVRLANAVHMDIVTHESGTVELRSTVTHKMQLKKEKVA